MKITTVVIALAFGGSIFLANDLAAQDPFTTDAKRDSLANAQYLVKTQKTTDAQTLSDLKHNKSDTKAQAKEAQRVEENAAHSAKESKSAYKTEKKAQKARRKADAQAKKAAKAKKKAE